MVAEFDLSDIAVGLVVLVETLVCTVGVLLVVEVYRLVLVGLGVTV